MITPSDIPELLKPGRTILLPGRILVSPHGKLIQEKKKTAILSSRPTEKYVEVPVYFIEGNKALGIIEIEKPRKFDLKDFEKLKKFHQVSDEERKKWWKDKEFLYYYPIKLISSFEPPKEIERPKGAQLWLKAVTFKSLEMFNPNEMTDEELFETHSRLASLWKEKAGSKEELINYNLLILNEIKNRKLNFPEETELDKESKRFQEEFSKAGFKITFFGTKGLVEEEGPYHQFHTSILYEFKGKRLLVDYGEKNQGNLSGIKPDWVLVSHSHPDHIGGLNDSQCIVSEDTVKEIPELYRDFNIDIRTQYKSYQTFELGPFKITPIPVLHSVRARMHVFLIEMGDKKVLQATDILSWHSNDREKYVKDLDLAIIDGSSFSKTLARRNVKYDEPFGHSSIINQLKNWYTRDKVKRIIITHLGKEPLSMGDEELLKKCKEITEVPVAIAKDNIVINLSEGTAPIYTSGKVLGRRIYLKDVLPYFKDFTIQRPLAYLTGGLVNQGSTKGDIDILFPAWLSFDMRRIIEFRIARSLPWYLRRRLHFVYDIFSTPFTHAVPLYNMVMLRSKDKMIKLSEIEKQLREKPRIESAIKDAEASAKEDKAELFRYFLPLKPTRGYYPEKRQTIDLFIEVMENMGNYPFYSEKKFDGINGEFHYDGKDKVVIFSEDGDEITKSLPTFVEQIKKLTNKPIILVGEIEHWHNGKHMPRESCNGLIHRKTGGSDEELIVNVYDIVYYGKDIHNLPFEERLKILDSLPFKQKTFYPPDTKIKFNETPHLLSKNRGELKKHTEFLRKLEGSEGNVCKTKDFKYNLKGIRSGMVKFHNSTVVYGKVLQVKETKVKGVYNYYFGLEKGGIKAKVEGLENTFYHRVGRSFSTNIKAKIGDVLEIEGETLNAEHNLKEDFWRLSLWAPRVMGKIDRKADSIKGAIERAKKNYCFQEKEITEEGKIIYKMLPAFGSVGGKRFLAKKIVQYFPEHKTYVEPFCGGASVFFAKKRSKQEVLNDRNPEIAFALKFIRDITPEKINRLKKFDWVKRRETFEKLKKLKPKNDFARFYKFFYTRLASYGNDVVTGFSPAKEGKEIQFENTLKRTSPRLKGVKIFNKDYGEIVRKFDSKDTLFFFDPPYPAHWDRWHSNRTHEKKFDEKRFEEVLKNLKGKFILSYETEGAKQFSDFYQMRIEAPARLDWKDKREKRYEVLISNFPLKKISIYLSEEIEKLHLKEFRSRGVDEDLKHPKEREKELIADLRYLANAGFPRLKTGKKWGEWRMADILKYFAKIVDTLHSIGVNIKPKKKSGSWYECWKRAEKYMKTQVEKQGDPYMKNPPENKIYHYACQSHFRSRTVHVDLRMETDNPDYLIGWTLADLVKGSIKEPVMSVKQAKELFNNGEAPYSKIDWKTGLPVKRPGIRPGYKEKYAEIVAIRKAPEPKVWEKVEGKVPAGEVGSTKNFPGVFIIIDKGRVEYGAQKCMNGKTELIVKDEDGYIKKAELGSIVKQKRRVEVLTPLGFKKIKRYFKIPLELEKYLEILLENGSSLKCDFQHPSFRFKDGKIEKVFAKDIREGDLIPIFSNGYEGTSGDYDLGRFLGLYLAEGSRAFKKNQELSFAFHEEEKDLIEFISSFAKSFGAKVNIRKNGKKKGKGICVNLCQAGALNGLIRQFIKKEKAGLRSEVFGLSLETRRGLIDGLHQGDNDDFKGYKYKAIGQGKKHISLLKDIHKLLFSIGEVASLNIWKGRGGRVTYSLNNSEKGFWHQYWINSQCFIKIKRISRAKPNGEHSLYDVELEDDHRIVLANGIITSNSYFHEYYFSEGRLKGRYFFRQLSPSQFKGQKERLEKGERILPPAKETQFRQEAPWFFIKPLDETPYVISKAAVKKKWIPSKGVSALPEKIRKKIPKEFQYWKFEDEKKRIEIRDALVEKLGKTLIEKKLNPGALWAKAAYRYVLSKQILNLWLKTPYPEKVERVRNALKEFKQLEPFKKEWLDDAITWLELRPTEMKRLIVQELKTEKTREVKWVLQHHWFRGPRVIRAGASIEHWDLRFDFPERENLMHFILEQNPLRNKEVTAISKPCKYKEWMNFSGYIPPTNERAKMTKEELAKLPHGVEEANPTKATSSYMEILDKGRAIVYEDSDLFKKFDFGGKKLKGLWVFVREDTSKFWTMKQSKLPNPK